MKQMGLTLRIVGVSIVLCCLIPFLKMPRLLAMIESRKRTVYTQEQELQRLIKKVDQIVRFKWFLIRNNCLRKNLLYYYFLLQAGMEGLRVRFGIRKNGDKLDGHCWLTWNDTVFLDTEEFVAQYVVIYSSRGA